MSDHGSLSEVNGIEGIKQHTHCDVLHPLQVQNSRMDSLVEGSSKALKPSDTKGFSHPNGKDSKNEKSMISGMTVRWDGDSEDSGNESPESERDFLNTHPPIDSGFGSDDPSLHEEKSPMRLVRTEHSGSAFFAPLPPARLKKENSKTSSQPSSGAHPQAPS